MNFPSFKKYYLAGYRASGFAGLVLITGMLVMYMLSFAFFLVNTTWVAPTILEPTSEKILPVQAETIRVRQFMSELEINLTTKQIEITNYETQKGGLLKLRARLESAKKSERSAAADVAGKSKTVVVAKQESVAKMQLLATDIERISKLAKQEFDAKLITEAEYSQRLVSISSLLGQQTDSRLALVTSEAASSEHQRVADTLGGRASHVSSLDVDAKLLEIDTRIADIDVHIIQRQAELAESVPQLKVLRDTVTTMNSTPYADIVKEGKLYLAFLPYDNHSYFKEGKAVYGCALVFVWCKKVGVTEKEYPNEQVVEFPLLNLRFSRTVRGTYVKLRLDDPSAAEKQVLFLGSKPLFL